jgi:hypothetical protein
LVPVVPGPYKNLFPQLRLLVNTLEQLGHEARIRVTASVRQLPGDLAAHTRIEPIGIIPHDRLACLWRTAWAAFFPCTLEAFGYPLAEARGYGIPVLAPASHQARELAGAALRGYDPRRPTTLADAIESIDDPLEPDLNPFDRDRYFDRLLDRSW